MSRYEKIVLLLTAVFITGCVGVFAFGGGRQNYTIEIDRNSAQSQTEAQTQTPHPDSMLPGEKININTASEWELARLPGIGEVRAADIVAYRQEHGPFETPEELIQVKGIGENIFKALQDYITIE